ncbi:MAG: HD domain-containing protein [Gemmatimonadaceae bacterium]
MERATATSSQGSADLRALPLVATVLVAAVGAVSVLQHRQGYPELSTLTVAAILTAIGLGAEFLSYNQTKTTSGSIAHVPFTAAVMIAPYALTVLLITAAEVVVQVSYKRSLLKAIFNLGQIALGLAVGTLAYVTSGGAPIGSFAAHGFLSTAANLAVPACVLVLTILVVNSGTVSAVIAITMRKSWMEVWLKHTSTTAKFFVLLVLLAFYLAWLTATLGVLGTIGMAIPLVAVRQLYKATLELTRVTEELLDLMVAAIEARDPYTSGHSQRVAKASEIIARAIGLSAAQIERVSVAALLHDVGKIDEAFARILAKEGRLSPEEWEVMKRHPIRSAELVGMLSGLQDVVAPVRHHHEKTGTVPATQTD